jgi:hypothetical protein
MTQAQICQITLQVFTNYFEDIYTDYFIIIFDAKNGHLESV